VIAFLHTSPVHVLTFAGLMQVHAPDCRVDHLVDESLLRDAQVLGVEDTGIVSRVTQRMQEASENGARVVVCTCSTIGGIAEKVDGYGRFVSMRIDRAMADEAVERGEQILIVAALASTIEPTRRLVEDSSAKRGRQVNIRTMVVQSAWPFFQSGDLVSYYARIEAAIRGEEGKPDVVVLAQASMAPVARSFIGADMQVLSSPELGVCRAIQAAQNL
jgi:hypothetical protein